MSDYRPILYHHPLSLECLRVRHQIGRLGVEIDLRDILVSAKHRADLEEFSGASAVPCLVLAHDVVVGTAEIMRYLRLRYGQRSARRGAPRDSAEDAR